MSRRHAVVVGGSLTAVTAADALRQQGFDGDITLLSEESTPPYARPPLSKGFLRGTESLDSVSLPEFADDITVRLATRATGLDVRGRRVVLADGRALPFTDLVIATGARARTLSSADQRGEIVLRTIEDAVALRDMLSARPTVIVVGGGPLGVEIASACCDLGLAVTVVSQRPMLLDQLGPVLATVMSQAAQEHGVRTKLAPGGARLLGRDRVTGIELSDGTRLEADVVITAAGCQANIEWLAGSGLTLHGGVVVDERGRAAPGIVAAGDVAAHRADPRSEFRRTPTFTHAIEHARVAAAALLHGDAANPYRMAPYFWTDAFGLAVKISGPLPAPDAPTVLSGSIAERSAVLQWSADGRPIRAATINHKISVGRLRKLSEPLAA